ncbi:terminase small subunit [Aquimarina macrocephali]|uniref:terminase small subunit n=1 Tax=Aquimarina macrocephali TaxID=666563 RepID=UPI003F662D76
MKLTKKQELFATEYVKLDDASAAYRKAYNTSKWKDKSVNEAASRMLKNIKVHARVKELQAIAAEIAEKEFRIDSKEILNHLNILRKSRIDEYINFVEIERKEENPKTKELEVIGVDLEMQFKPFDQLTEEQLMCIESIKQGRNGIELKLHGKDWTIDKIAKHIGFYAEHNYQKNNDLTKEERVKRIAELKEKLNK